MVIHVIWCFYSGEKKNKGLHFFCQKHTHTVASKHNTAKGNRERLGTAEHQEVNAGRKCHLNRSPFLHVLSLTPDNIREKHRRSRPLSQGGERPPLDLSPHRRSLTRKYFCLSSFSWKDEPKTAICPSYLVPFCRRRGKSRSMSVKPFFFLTLLYLAVFH